MSHNDTFYGLSMFLVNIYGTEGVVMAHFKRIPYNN